jgi:predicted hotdog family 3-hydroxylacyl-ACP dehydratase
MAKGMKSILNASEIEQCLPHAGKMSLLESVIETSQRHLKASAISHYQQDNPLLLNGQLSIIHGVEYAAQAMAVHGFLLSDSRAKGYIATLRSINMSVRYFPNRTFPLMIEVEQLIRHKQGFTYQFIIHCEQTRLISGKITVFLM